MDREDANRRMSGILAGHGVLRYHAGATISAFVVAKWGGAWVLPVSGLQTPTSITAMGVTSLSEFAVGEVKGADLPDTADDTFASASWALGLVVILALLPGLVLVWLIVRGRRLV